MIAPDVADAIASERAAVVAEARSWIGTPFHHAARIKGVGVDCIQLVIACVVAAGVAEEPAIERYPPGWFLHQDRERLTEAMQPYAVLRTPSESAQVGDVAVFRFGRAVSHAAIVIATAPEVRVVHSVARIGAVEDVIGPRTPLGVRLAGYWCIDRRRAAFAEEA